MVEQFELAAWRHLETAWMLQGSSYHDDAGYHFGMVGETALKELVIKSVGSLPPTLYGHLGPGEHKLQEKLAQARAELALMASGRLGAVSIPDPIPDFSGWRIDIRYHDDTICPVPQSQVSNWERDAITLIELI